MQDQFAAAQEAIAFSIGSVAVLGTVIATGALAARWAIKMMTGSGPGQYINNVWVSGHDIKAFAGFHVAIDPDTDELMAVETSYERLSAEMHLRYPERDWVPVSIPGERCQSLARLISIGKE